LIRAHRKGLIATTLNFDYEVRSAKTAFKEIGKHKIEPEMLELAQHILKTKAGTFKPDSFEDRYEEALADLVKAKIDGRTVVPLQRPEPTKKNDLLEALRLSAGDKGSSDSMKAAAKKPAARSRSKAGAKKTATAHRKAS
jgi:DNA end-binding protein Ku